MLNKLIARIKNRLAREYPLILKQSTIDPAGILFEVANPIEKWRVESMDDEIDFLTRFLNCLESQDVVYDIGACIGIYALHAAKKCKAVYAFEPDVGFTKHLEVNITLNHASNISIQPYAASNQTGVFYLYTGGVAGKSPSLRNFGQGRRILIKTFRLDDKITMQELPAPHVIKMDIEGAEYNALRGMKEIFCSASAPRMLFIELHPKFLQKFESSSEQVHAFLNQLGYQLVSHDVRHEQEHCIFRKNL